MLDDIKIDIIDLDKVNHFIDGLTKIDSSKAIKKGFWKASEYVSRQGGKELLRTEHGGVKDGHLLNSISPRVKRKKQGALIGFKIPGGQASWLHDRGTVPRYTKRGAYRGVMPASYFWQKTRDIHVPVAIEKIYDGIRDYAYKLKTGNG